MESINAGSSSSLNSSHKITQTAKRKFFQWAVKWFYANISEDFETKPDAPVLASLLQSIGFQLREFGKIQETLNTDKQELKKDSIRVTIECGTSGMRACLEMDDVKCQCPNSELAEDASFWSSSGTGPAARVESTTKIEDSGSNLLPAVSKVTKKVLSDVTYRLFDLINDKTIDVNRNTASHSNLNLSRISSISKEILEDIPIVESVKNDSISIIRSHTQPEIILSGGERAANRYKSDGLALIKERISEVSRLIPKSLNKTIDLEDESFNEDQPRPSPPKIMSSPVMLSQVCSSLSHISLASDEESGTLAELVINAQRSINKAVEILCRNSLTSPSSSIYELGSFSKPREDVSNVTGSELRKKSLSNLSNISLRSNKTSGSISRPSSSCSMSANNRLAPITNRQVLSLPKTNSGLSRRSVDSALTTMSTIPMAVNKRSNTNSNLIPPSNPTGPSKMLSRRNSFAAFNDQPVKLTTVKPRAPINDTRKISAISPRNQSSASGIKKPGSTVNQSVNAASVPIIKPQPIVPTVTIKQPNTRKSLVAPKFGFTNKKL